ncbi:MAG: DUF167 domain-containing protein [Bdellovibrionia bacterium]
MKINVKVKIRSKIEKVEKIDDHNFEVWVNAPPVDGKANERIKELLAEHLNLRPSKVILIKGEKSKSKTFEILTSP